MTLHALWVRGCGHSHVFADLPLVSKHLHGILITMNKWPWFFFSHFFLFTVTLYLLHLSFVCTSGLIVLYVRINTEYIYYCTYIKDNVRTGVANCLCTHECYFGVYCPSCEATRDMNTKLNFEWVHEEFVTAVHRPTWRVCHDST